MRIAYLISEYPSPSHTFIRREIEALRARGLTILPVSIRLGTRGDVPEHVPSILESRWRCLRAAFATLARAPLRSLSAWMLAQRHRSLGVRGWIWAQFHLIEALALANLLSNERVTHLHSHFANSGATVGMLAAHVLRLPWSLTLHGISETDAPAGSLLPEKLIRARFVACASWFMRAQAMRVSPPELWSKFHVIRCGVDLTRLPSADEKHVTAGGPIRFLTVGRLSAEKGHSGLLQSFSALVAQGCNAKLTIVGDGPLRASLEREVQDCGHSGRVFMTGALSEDLVLSAMEQADVFVLPSLMEGLPVVLMEAMALSKPVIAPAIAGIPELVSDGRTGLLFRPGDWTQLADRMQQFAHEATARRECGQRGRDVIESEFEINAAVGPLEILFSTSAMDALRRDQ